MERIGDTMARQGLKGSKKASGSHSKPEFNCIVCKDAGWVLDKDGQTIRCMCVRDEDQKRRYKRYIAKCGLPSDTEHMTFENFKRSPALKEAFNAALQLAGEKDLKWLTLMSDVDRGKTHLAIAICRRWLARGKPARYAYVPLLLDELRLGFESRDESYNERYQFFMKVPLLVLDDLGVESSTPWVQEKLDTIIDYRAVHGLSLVVTTNKPMDELPVRIASRLQRHPHGKVVVISGPEYRLVDGQKK